jgi:hypothetical protein
LLARADEQGLSPEERVQRVENMAAFMKGISEKALVKDNFERGKKKGFEDPAYEREFGRMLFKGAFILTEFENANCTNELKILNEKKDAIRDDDYIDAISIALALGRYDEAQNFLTAYAGRFIPGFEKNEESLRSALEYVNLVHSLYDDINKKNIDENDPLLKNIAVGIRAVDVRSINRATRPSLYNGLSRLKASGTKGIADDASLLGTISEKAIPQDSRLVGRYIDAMYANGELNYEQRGPVLNTAVIRLRSAVENKADDPVAITELLRIFDRVSDLYHIETPIDEVKRMDMKSYLALLGAG